VTREIWKPGLLHDNTEPQSDAWTDWLLQSVRESRVEKTQIVETFGDTYLYAFGQKPRALVFNGILMNTTDYNWRAVFWQNWDNFFRATRLIEKNARMYISWDDLVVEGYPINAVCNQTVDSPNALTFSFNFFVTRYINVDADSGFQRNRFRGDNISALTTGYDPSTAKLSFNNKISAIEMLGLAGATFTGGALQKILLEGGVDPALASTAGRTVGAMHRAVLTGTLAGIRGSYNGAAFLRAFLQKQAYDVTRDLTNMAFRELEKSMGVRKSDVNAFFGLMASLLHDVDGMGDSVMGRLLLHGSVDRIIQSMAYHTADIGLLGTEQELIDRSSPRPGTITSFTRPGVVDAGAGIFPEIADSSGFLAGGIALLGLGIAAGTLSASLSVERAGPEAIVI
jgi:hypothetical protein